MQDRQPVPLDEAAIRQQLDRILASRCFAHAQRLRLMLQFLVTQTLAGNPGDLKESVIGCEVCGRPPSFDTKVDPIVRVDANRLRSRLRAYYEGEGAADPVRVHLPKGTYVPAFEASPGVRSHVAGNDHGAIAVLPLVNLSGMEEQEFFGDSLTEQIIHRLSRVEGLRVIARGSVFQFKGRKLDLRLIGQQLGVDYLLDGSVRVVDRRLRITLQMCDARSGCLLWSERYERSWDRILEIEEEIAAAVTDSLCIRLDAQYTTVLTHTTDNADAYAHYLRGRYFWNQRTPESLEASLDSYAKALEHDSQFTSAHAGIADTLMVMALNDQIGTLAAMARARAAARRAVELSPASPDALVSLAAVKAIFDWDWEGSERLMKRALERHPGSAVAHYLHAILVLQPQGRWEEASREMELAERLDPVSPVLLRDTGMLHFMRRDWESARLAYGRLEMLAPGFRGGLYWRARLAIEQGLFDEALQLLDMRVGAGRSNSRVTATIGYAWARSGRREDARGMLSELMHGKGWHGRVPPLDFALLYLGLEEYDEALQWLAKACEERAAPLYQFAVDPAYDCIRADARAQALRLAIGLPQPVTPR